LDAVIRAIEYDYPAQELNNDMLARDFPTWNAEKMRSQTGIEIRHIAAADEFSSDMAVRVASRLFDSGAITPAEIDFIILCTQTPDTLSPTTACQIQHRLGVPTTAGAMDINLGCSGYVYSLAVAQGLIATGQARNLLLLTADTPSKFVGQDDVTVRALFGDGASATLIQAVSHDGPASIGPFDFGTDGGGAKRIGMLRGGAKTSAVNGPSPAELEARGEKTTLHMEGTGVFTFSLRVVPKSIDCLLARVGLRREDVDLYVFHQANGFILEHLRKKLGIPPEKFVLEIADGGNTVSSTIPIALKRCLDRGQIRPGCLLLLIGFGVGLSWASTLVRWRADAPASSPAAVRSQL
jgi:3-oxoacyl-[acyl-carrier-protein] synthase III